MKKTIMYGLIALLILGIATAGILTTRDKELPKEDKEALGKVGVIDYKVIKDRDKSNNNPTSVCIKFSSTFTDYCKSLDQYKSVCTEEEPIPKEDEPPIEWECPKYIEVLKSNAELEAEAVIIEDRRLEQVTTRAKITEANNLVKETVETETEEVIVTIKEAK